MGNLEHLYDRGYIINLNDSESVLYRNFINYRVSKEDTFHVIIENETLYDIAREYLGSSSMWFMVADVNKDIEDIFDITVGDTILIPNLG